MRLLHVLLEDGRVLEGGSIALLLLLGSGCGVVNWGGGQLGPL